VGWRSPSPAATLDGHLTRVQFGTDRDFLVAQTSPGEGANSSHQERPGQEWSVL
jgi:hypothetical protein